MLGYFCPNLLTKTVSTGLQVGGAPKSTEIANGYKTANFSKQCTSRTDNTHCTSFLWVLYASGPTGFHSWNKYLLESLEVLDSEEKIGAVNSLA